MFNSFKKVFGIVACSASILSTVFASPISLNTPIFSRDAHEVHQASSPVFRRDPTVAAAFAAINPTTYLIWHSCLNGFFCAVLDVPLDYAMPGGARAKLPLLKKSATTTPYKGMMFINPGGPGLSAIDVLLNPNSFAIFAGVVPTNFDIVAFEPRGIGYSTPLASCSLTPPPKVRKRVFYQPYGPRLPAQWYQGQYTFGQNLGTQCSAAIGGPNGAGKYMSTAVVVRDAISILDAYAVSGHSIGVTNPTYFNYWGFSYGTIIGQTFAMMYPNRVGRFVLDGVNDAVDYYSAAGLKNIYLADRTLASFFTYCNLAGPTQCAFYTGTTPQDIFQRFEYIALKLDAKRAYLENWSNKTEITTALENFKIFATNAAYSALYNFPLYAQALTLFEAYAFGGLTYATLSQYLPLAAYTVQGIPNLQWGTGVICTDNGNALLGKTLPQMQGQITKAENQSWVFGEFFITKSFPCTTWAIPGIGRYTGGFGGNTKSPILFVSNTIDPVTPSPNGANAQFIFNKAKLLTIDGVGHMSININNQCANAKIRAYMAGGAPGNSFCAMEAGPWGITLPSSSTLAQGTAGADALLQADYQYDASSLGPVLAEKMRLMTS